MSYADPARVPENHRSSNDPSIQSEPTGPIASDSLAAESLQSGGDFADGNAEPLGVKGANSTLNTTDTSGANPLPPATSGAARERAAAKGLGNDERGTAGGVRYPDADASQASGTATSEGHYYGGPSAGNPISGYDTSGADLGSGQGGDPRGQSEQQWETVRSAGQQGSSGSGNIQSQQSGSGSSGPSAGAGVRPHVDAAPNYAGRVSGAITGDGDELPKGDHLVEGGDVPDNIKTFTGNVGGSKDPGRLAEQKFEAINASAAGGGTGEGMGRGDEGTTDGGQYGTLQSERLD